MSPADVAAIVERGGQQVGCGTGKSRAKLWKWCRQVPRAQKPTRERAGGATRAAPSQGFPHRPWMEPGKTTMSLDTCRQSGLPADIA